MVALVGKYLCYALLALSLDLVWGYCGILSLGHGAFFALGGYAMGMYLMRQIGPRGVYGNPDLPDFMVFLNWKELPWFWYGFDQFWFAALMVMLVPGLLAFVFGWFAFRSRVTGVYLSIITQAMTYALLLAFFRNDMGFGGNNGLTDFKDILGFNVQANATRSALFSASAIALALGVLVTWLIVTSKYGKLLIAVRDAESRTRFLGWRAENVKLFAFTVSAVMAGIAGALYVPQVGIINPGEFDPGNSIEVVVWTAVGGRGTIVGPIIGALLVNAGKSWFTGALPELWLFALGGLFVAVTLFLPKGILGLWDQWRGASGKRERMPRSAAEAGTDTDHRRRRSCARSRRTIRRVGETQRRPRAAAGGVGEMSKSGTILYLDGVSVAFDGFRAINNLSLVLDKGEMRAIIGPNGAGKTTMMDIVTGKTRPDEGEVFFDGLVDLTKHDEAEIAMMGIGRKFQKPTVFESHTVEDNLVLSLNGSRSIFPALFHRRSADEARRIDDILGVTRLGDKRDTLAANLSHGQKQWLEIGMLLAQDPKLLLVDEPVAGMTDAETVETARLLKDINQMHSVIVVEHDMHFVRELGVKVTCLHEGSVLSEGTLDFVSADDRVVEVYLGR